MNAGTAGSKPPTLHEHCEGEYKEHHDAQQVKCIVEGEHGCLLEEFPVNDFEAAL